MSLRFADKYHRDDKCCNYKNHDNIYKLQMIIVTFIDNGNINVVFVQNELIKFVVFCFVL